MDDFDDIQQFVNLGKRLLPSAIDRGNFYYNSKYERKAKKARSDWIK